MHELVSIPVVDLVLDEANARLGDEQPSQQAIYLALSKQQGARLVSLAADIVASGLDPTTLPAVVATADRHRRYRVIEGNRRILAVKALENPAIVAGGLASSQLTRLTTLSKEYSENPIDKVQCILFDTEEEAFHWVELRHTGANDGAGLVEWDTNEQDRFKTRHGKGATRKPAGQILDFIDDLDGPSESKAKVLTTLERIVNTPEVRKALGIELRQGQVVSNYPSNEVAKGLRRIVGDLRDQTIKVKDVYEAEQRKDYIAAFSAQELPDPATRFAEPIALGELGKASPQPAPKAGKKPAKKKPAAARTAIVPSSCTINPKPPRINDIFNELSALDVDTYPNAGSVLLRVFLELSVDHELTRLEAMSEKDQRTKSLAKRLIALAAHMLSEGRISDQLNKAVGKIASSQHTIAAATVTFNQFVHNEYVMPKPSELRTAWDELQPFMEKVWE